MCWRRESSRWWNRCSRKPGRRHRARWVTGLPAGRDAMAAARRMMGRAACARGEADTAANLEIPPTLVLTGHFPPEPGGVQTFTWELLRRLAASRLLVIAPAWPGAGRFDRGLDFPVIRRHGYMLFRGLCGPARTHGARAGWIPAMAPFGLYAPALRAAMRAVDSLTYLSAVTRAELAAAGMPERQLVRLAGGVDVDRFRPGIDATQTRARYGARCRACGGERGQAGATQRTRRAAASLGGGHQAAA